MTMGIDGVFMEVHKDPDHAMSDGPNQVYLKDLEKILSNLMLVRKAYQQMASI
jgi:2-dehydro-3-deoxyphosphooctonate aldolase (KDO 8-P synthase)